jgi:hypothetical protein
VNYQGWVAIRLGNMIEIKRLNASDLKGVIIPRPESIPGVFLALRGAARLPDYYLLGG